MVSPIKSFIVGSSLATFIFTFLYMGYAYRQKATKEGAEAARQVLQYEVFAVMIPLIFGIVNVMANWYGPASTMRMALFGAAVGFFLSNIGTFVLHLPTELFGATNRYQYLWIAPLLYAAIWGIVVNWLNRSYIT